MKIFLTGASGFAGAHMLKYLMENTSTHVTCPVTYTHGGHPDRINSIVPQSFSERYTTARIDLARSVDLDEVDFSEFDLVINYASESHVDRSISNPRSFATNNSDLMINLLEKIRQFPSLPFVHLSTDEVYGSIPVGQSNYEYERIHRPSNPYSASKSAQESLLIAYYKTYKLPIAIVNSTNMLGEAQNREKFIPKAIYKISNGESINVDTDNDGKIGTRKYLDVNDVARAIWKISLALIDKNLPTQDMDLPFKLHISGTEEISNLEVIQIIAKELNKVPATEISPSPRPGYDLRYELSSKFSKEIDWEPQESSRERIADICQWTLAHPSWMYNDHSMN
jgi:dTDP-glucose 4,6-dehydratase